MSSPKFRLSAKGFNINPGLAGESADNLLSEGNCVQICLLGFVPDVKMQSEISMEQSIINGSGAYIAKPDFRCPNVHISISNIGPSLWFKRNILITDGLWISFQTAFCMAEDSGCLTLLMTSPEN